ncbi:MAG: protein phosphatase 2C domain-containing protein [Candidatus Margulisiibacteriota bacterium]
MAVRTSTALGPHEQIIRHRLPEIAQRLAEGRSLPGLHGLTPINPCAIADVCGKVIADGHPNKEAAQAILEGTKGLDTEALLRSQLSQLQMAVMAPLPTFQVMLFGAENPEISGGFGKMGYALTQGIRSYNQDSGALIQFPKRTIALAADGMGGHKLGELASKIAVEAAVKHLMTDGIFSELVEVTGWGFTDEALRLYEQDPAAYLNAICHKSSQRRGVIQKLLKMFSGPETPGMGTTLCALSLEETGTVVVNVGDSRARVYIREKDGEVMPYLLTADHSVARERQAPDQKAPLDLEGIKKLEEALNRNNADSNVITSSLGTFGVALNHDTGLYEFAEPNHHLVFRLPHRESAEGEALYLLSSDGLVDGKMSELKLLEIVSAMFDEPAEKIAAAVTKEALKLGSMDNIIALAVKSDTIPDVDDPIIISRK